MSDLATPKPQPRPHYWRLIAVVVSSIALDPKLAMWLYDAAVELYAAEGDDASLKGELADGKLKNLRRDYLLGQIGGPGFEATLETPGGKAQVRFLVTREGLAHAERSRASETVN